LDFIVSHFEMVKQTPDFLELRHEPDLLITLVLRIR